MRDITCFPKNRPHLHTVEVAGSQDSAQCESARPNVMREPKASVQGVTLVNPASPILLSQDQLFNS